MIEFEECDVETNEENFSSAADELDWMNSLYKGKHENNLLTSKENVIIGNSEKVQDDKNGITSDTPVGIFKYSLRYDCVFVQIHLFRFFVD